MVQIMLASVTAVSKTSLDINCVGSAMAYVFVSVIIIRFRLSKFRSNILQWGCTWLLGKIRLPAPPPEGQTGQTTPLPRKIQKVEESCSPANFTKKWFPPLVQIGQKSRESPEGRSIPLLAQALLSAFVWRRRQIKECVSITRRAEQSKAVVYKIAVLAQLLFRPLVVKKVYINDPRFLIFNASSIDRRVF